MSLRLHTCVLLLVLGPGCNLILPSLPADGVTAPDAAGDGIATSDSPGGADLSSPTDHSVRPDTPMGWDLPPGTDVPTDLPGPDGGEDVTAPPLWECQTPVGLLAESLETHSFTRFGVSAENNFLYIYYSLCGVEEPISGPEKGWFLLVDEVSTLGVQVACDGPCWAYLMKDGCNYQNIEACWSPHDTPLLSWSVLPGTWYVAVEQMEEEGVPAAPGWVGPPFDIHVALNRTHGHPGCVEDGVLPLSEVLATGACEAQDDTTWRVWTRVGSLPSPGEATDRVWLPCTAGALPVDPVGGMPETILRLVTDLPGEARRVRVTATLDPGVPGGLPGWAGILGIAGPPCGETTALVDCDGGRKKELRVTDVTLLPGQEAFLYLDGVGEEALDGPIPRPYRLDVRVEADCIP